MSRTERLLDLIRARAASVAAGYPQCVYSYSSRASRDLGGFCADTYGGNPRPLVSLYDVRYKLDLAAIEARSDYRPERFLDSGGFETGVSAEPWTLAGPEGDQPWDRGAYAAVARALARAGDTLVSFDARGPIADQLAEGLDALDQAALPGVRRDLLLHVEGTDPVEVADAVAAVADRIDLLGVTEKEIGLPWFVGAAYLRSLRRRLAERAGRAIPIHVFGCLDPRTMPLLFLAGADVFDGLGWHRYYFRDRHAYYAREFEHDAPLAVLGDWRTSQRALAAHNIGVMEAIVGDLRYAVAAEDVEAATACAVDFLDAVPGA